MKIIEINPDFRAAVEANDGYCPCLIEQNEDTKCPCKDFRDQKEPGACHCGRFEKRMEKPEKVIAALENCVGSGCMGCEYADITGGFDECMGALMKDALRVIKDLQEKLKTAKDGRLELARKLRVVTVERDAERAKIARLTGMVHKEWLEKVRPDWYERLSNLDYEYSPVKDGEPWYHVKDVWDCIEEVAE